MGTIKREIYELKLTTINIKEELNKDMGNLRKKNQREILRKCLFSQTKNLESVLKAEREKKQIMYKGKPIKKAADFSMETLKERSVWSEVFWALNENNFSPRILYPAKLSFKIDRAIKIFQDKQKRK
jgi:hypothetical protein